MVTDLLVCECSDHFGVSNAGECVLLGGPAGAEEACALDVMVCRVDLPGGLLLWDCVERVSPCPVHSNHHPVGNWRSPRQRLRPLTRSGTHDTTAKSLTSWL
jgi:hypothetical protein